MFNNQYYHGAIAKYTTVFGDLFNDMHIQRFDSSKNRVQTVAVPITYAPKEKQLARLNQDPNLDRRFAIQLPMMSYEITNVSYAPERKLNTMHRQKMITIDNGTVKSQYMPVPYDISFQLNIYSKYAEEGMQLLEMILPFFTPEYTTNIRLIPEMDISLSIPFVLEGVSFDDTYEGDFQTRRAIIYTLSFICKGYIFGPVSTNAVIKTSIANLFNYVNGQKAVSITVTPSQYANAAPLNSPAANSSLSVSIDSISANSTYGYTTVIDEVNP